MKLCPVAIAVGCRRCPVFKVCPAKSLIGDQPPAAQVVASPAPRKPAKRAASKTAASAPKKSPARKRRS